MRWVGLTIRGIDERPVTRTPGSTTNARQRSAGSRNRLRQDQRHHHDADRARTRGSRSCRRRSSSVKAHQRRCSGPLGGGTRVVERLPGAPRRARGRRIATSALALMVVIPSGRSRSLYGARPEARLTMRTPEEIASGEHLGAHPRCRRRGRAARRGGRRRPRRRGRRRAAAGPSPRACARGGRCRCGRSGRPPAISTTRSSHIARHWPDPQRAARAAAGACGAGTAPRRGRRCRRRRPPPGPSAGRRSARWLRVIRRPGPRPGRRPARSGSGPSRRDHLVAPLGSDQLAHDGAAQVGVRRSARSWLPAAAGPGRRAAGASAAPACTSKVPIRPRWTCTHARRRANSTNRCLPAASAPHQHGAVDQRGAVGEPALRAATRATGRPPKAASRSRASRWRVWPSGIAGHDWPAAGRTAAAAAGRRCARSRRACRSGGRAAPRR